MLHQSLEASLRTAKHALQEANSENIIELGERYVTLLNEFRAELYKFRGKSEIDLRQANSIALEATLGKRREIRLAITELVQELNQTESLLSRLTSASGRETIDTFNRLNYRGYHNWEFRGGIVGRLDSSPADQISIHEAVSIAVKLRCEEFIQPKNL